MEKEKFFSKFIEDLLKLGVQPGGVLMVHSALRPFGHVPGGAETIIQGLLTVLGESGTLLMPALTYETVTPENRVFDVRKTPSCVGKIAEVFRLQSNTRRSFHPTHSVCGVGKFANEILSSHIEDSTPCGKNSPFSRLVEFDGQILMLACSLIYNTSLHAIEELFEPPYLYDPPIVYTLIDNNSKVVDKTYTPHNFKGWRQRYDRISELMKKPSLRVGLTCGVPSYLLDTRDLWLTAKNALNNDELFFIEKF